MKQTNPILISLCLIFIVIFGANLAGAQTTNYFDAFNRTGALNGSTPSPVDTGSTVWSAQTLWNCSTTASGEVVGTGGSTPFAALLPFTVTQSNCVYVLSYSIIGLTGTAGNWCGFGFWNTTNTTGSSAFSGALDWSLQQVNGIGQTFYGNGSLAGGSGNIAGAGGTGNYSITLTVAADGSGTVTFAKNGTAYGSVRSLTAAQVALIKGVGITLANGVTATLQNFQLTATPVAGPPSSATINPASSTVLSGTPVTLTAAVLGSLPLYYQWQEYDNISTYTNVSPVTTNNSLVVDTTFLNGTYSYQVIVTNNSGSVTSAVPATITVSQQAPTLSSDTAPTNRISYTGRAATFSAIITGSTPATNAWQFSPNPDGSGAITLTTQTNSTISFTSLSLTNTGYYSLQSANAFGTLNSSWAHLTVLDTSLQTNGLWIDSFSRSGALNGSTADVTNVSGAWKTFGGWTNTGSQLTISGITGADGGRLCPFPLTLSPGKVYQVSFEVLSLTGTAANWVGLGFWNSTNTTDTIYGKSVALMLAKVNGIGQSFYGAPGLNNPSGDVAGAGGLGTYAINLTVLSSGSAVVEFIQNGIVLRTGSLTPSQVANITGVGPTGQNGITATIDNFRVETLPFPGIPTANAPTISPNSTVYAGTPVTLNIAAGGAQPLYYQWQQYDGSSTFTNLPGATSTNLLVDTTALSGAYQYEVVITNVNGTFITPAATLTVNPASIPILTQDTQPYSLDVPVGQSATFTAGFTGTLPISYQWQIATDSSGSGATNLPGQTNTTLNLTNIQNSNAGYYSLQASNNVGGPVNSTWAPLTVHAGVNQLVVPANTTNIYWDQFSYTAGNLAFNAPDTANTPNEVWYAQNGGFALPGSELEVKNGWLANLAFTPQTNNTYLLSAFLQPPNGDGTAYNALGFSTQYHSFPGNAGWITYVAANSDGTGSTYAGAAAASSYVSGLAPYGGPGTYDVLLTVNSDGSGTVVYAKNREAFATNTLTSAQVSSIRSVSVSGNSASYGIVEQFKLAVYPVTPTTPPNLTLGFSGGSLQLTWSAGSTLLQATNLLGPWTTNTGSSPLTIIPTAPKMFYRAFYP